MSIIINYEKYISIYHYTYVPNYYARRLISKLNVSSQPFYFDFPSFWSFHTMNMTFNNILNTCLTDYWTWQNHIKIPTKSSNYCTSAPFVVLMGLLMCVGWLVMGSVVLYNCWLGSCPLVIYNPITAFIVLVSFYWRGTI